MPNENEYENAENQAAVQEPVVKPEVSFLSDVLAEIERGSIRIPNFQRDFVWRPSDMLDLFDSLQKGYPIGSLLLWETSGNYESRSKVGPIPIRPVKPGELVALALDGQQRLTTLFGVLRLAENHPRDAEPDNFRWWIFYDLKERRFVHFTEWPNAEPPPHFLPLRTVFRTVDFLKFARELSKQPSDSASAWIDAAEEIVRRISGYRIALIRIREGTLDQAVEIFSRLNTRGRKMKPDEMISALSYREGRDTENFHLAKKVDEIVAELVPFGFGGFDRTLIFRAIVAQSGDTSSRTNWEALANKIKKDLPTLTEATRAGLVDGVRFLGDTLKVPSVGYLPYGHQLVCLCHFFSSLQKGPEGTVSEVRKRGLKKWFYWTSYSGWFGGANSTKTKQALDAMKQMALAKTEEEMAESLLPFVVGQIARPMPSRFHLGSARVRALLLVMMDRKTPLGPDGKPIDPVKNRQEKGNGAEDSSSFPYVFRNLETQWQTHPANRVLFPRECYPYALAKLRCLQEPLRSAVYESQFISPKATVHLQSGDGSAFVQQRTEDLRQAEEDFLKEHGIPLPSEQGPSFPGQTPIEDSDAEDN